MVYPFICSFTDRTVEFDKKRVERERGTGGGPGGGPEGGGI